MKHKFFTCICAVVLVIALLLAGCANNQAALGPSNHSKYASALGLSKKEACEVIGIQQEDMTEFVIAIFSTPLKAELAGQTFEVNLSFNALSEEEELLQIIYRAIYSDLSNTTVEAVNAIASALEEQYGEPSRRNDSGDEDEQIPKGYTYWDLTETASQELSAYMKQLEKEYGGTAYYELVLHVNPYDDTCVVDVSYVVGVTPAK